MWAEFLETNMSIIFTFLTFAFLKLKIEILKWKFQAISNKGHMKPPFFLLVLNINLHIVFGNNLFHSLKTATSGLDEQM